VGLEPLGRIGGHEVGPLRAPPLPADPLPRRPHAPREHDWVVVATQSNYFHKRPITNPTTAPVNAELAPASQN
jgi:hypothetical protein